MGLMKTALTAYTMKRLLLDQGLVYVDYGLGTERLLGATRGGNKPEVTGDMRQMPFDGVPGDVKGDKRWVGRNVKLTVNLVEFSTENHEIMLPGFDAVTGATHDVLTCDRNVADGDYLSNVTLVLEKKGTTELWYFKLLNALVVSGFSMDNKEKDEGTVSVEFVGHMDVDDLETLPVEIGNPLEAVTGYFTRTYLAGANGQVLGKTPQIVKSGGSGSPVYAAAATGYHFTTWSDAVLTAERTDTNVLSDATLTASFVID